jgi:hypothetical protein
MVLYFFYKKRYVGVDIVLEKKGEVACMHAYHESDVRTCVSVSWLLQGLVG